MEVLSDDLMAAVRCHEAGQLQEAAARYEQLLQREPHNPVLLHLFGVLAFQCGQPSEALDRIGRAIALDPAQPLFHSNLANVLKSQGRAQEALESFRRALELDPGFAEAHYNLALLLEELGRLEESERSYRDAIRNDPALHQAHNNLGNLLKRRGARDEALQSFSEALRLDPTNQAYAYTVAALSGEALPAAAPAAYVAGLYDHYADRFEQHLVQVLDYRVPEMIRADIESLRPLGSLDVLDLGCGTGRCGELLRDLARRLVGVDVSSRMIEKARARSVYDQLHRADLLQALSASDAEWDLIVAADVLIYCGDLAAVFLAVGRALRAGGLFVFSVESHDKEESYCLNRTGRYSHSRRYLDALARECAFDPLLVRSITVRLQFGEPVPGLLAVFTPAEASRAGI